MGFLMLDFIMAVIASYAIEAPGTLGYFWLWVVIRCSRLKSCVFSRTSSS